MLVFSTRDVFQCNKIRVLAGFFTIRSTAGVTSVVMVRFATGDPIFSGVTASQGSLSSYLLC